MKVKLIAFILTLALALSTSYITVSAAPLSKTCYGTYWQTTYVKQNKKYVAVKKLVRYSYTCPSFDWNTNTATGSGTLK